MAQIFSSHGSILAHRSSTSKFSCVAYALIVVSVASVGPSTALSDIYSLDGDIIPGTEGITPGPSTSFDGLDLRNADLRFVDLSGSSFVGAITSRASFFGSTLLDVDFSEVVMGDVRLDGFNLAGTRLARSGLVNASFVAANLEHIDLSHSSLTSSNFIGANLQGVNLTGARIDDSQFIAADLRHATLAHVGSKKRIDFTLATLELADVSDAWMNDARFDSADLSGASLRGSTIVGSMPNADLRGALVQHADLRNVEGMDTAVFDFRTQYNEWTLFPVGFDPAEYGLTLVPATPGDMNGDDLLTAWDIELLMRNERGQIDYLSPFDLNQDMAIDATDRIIWVHDIKQAWFGDVNLDGEFNSRDIVLVFEAGLFETGRYGATWTTGDWNADSLFTTSDLLMAFQDGGYERGPRVPPVAVPEPATALTLLIGALFSLRQRLGGARYL